VNRIDRLVFQDTITGVLVLSWVQLVHISRVFVFMSPRQDNRESNDENQNSHDQESESAKDDNSSLGEGARKESREESLLLFILGITKLFMFRLRPTARELTSSEGLNRCCGLGGLVLGTSRCEEVQHLERGPRSLRGAFTVPVSVEIYFWAEVSPSSCSPVGR
jgi:hypothetical protein